MNIEIFILYRYVAGSVYADAAPVPVVLYSAVVVIPLMYFDTTLIGAAILCTHNNNII